MHKFDQIIEKCRLAISQLNLTKADIFLSTIDQTRIDLNNGDLRLEHAQNESALSLRLSKGADCTGFYTKDLDLESIKSKITHHYQRLEKGHETFLGNPEPSNYSGEAFIDFSDSSARLVSLDEKVRRIQQFWGKLKSVEGVSYCRSQFIETKRNRYFWSLGSDQALAETGHYYNVNATLGFQTSWGDPLHSQFVADQKKYFNINWPEMSESLEKRVKDQSQPTFVSTANTDRVILSGHVMARLFEIFHYLFCSEHQHFSKQEICFSPKVGIIDDPFLTERKGTRLWDDEGEESKRFYVVREGQLTHPLTTRSLTNPQHYRHTGNAFRTSKIPLIKTHPNNLFIEPSQSDTVDLFRFAENAIFIEDIVGSDIYQSSGRHCQFFGIGKMIRSAEETDILPVTKFEIDFFDLMKNLEMCGRHLRWLGHFGAPDCFFSRGVKLLRE